MVRGSMSYPGSWFPVAYVCTLKCDHIESTGYLGQDLLAIWTTYSKYSRAMALADMLQYMSLSVGFF